jgi:hypothetical protein
MSKPPTKSRLMYAPSDPKNSFFAKLPLLVRQANSPKLCLRRSPRSPQQQPRKR